MVLGAQLYTIRNYIQTEDDIRRSLKKIANMGYKTVQVSAMGKIAPEVLKEICDELLLKIVLTHTNADRILNETEQVIHEHEILGCNYIGLGAMPDKYRTSEWYENFALDFKEPAKKIANAGKLFMYHNHSFEFEKVNGKRIIERLIEDFSADEMGFTLDTYWVQAAGADIFQWIDILKDRIPCVHLKDMTVRGFEQMMALQDTCQGSPFDCLQISYNNLSRLGYK